MALACLGGVLLWGAGSFAGEVRAAGAAGALGVRVVRADAGVVLVEITAPPPNVVPVGVRETSWSVEGWSWTREEGAPELPVTGFDLAVPPGTRPVLSVRVLASLPWPGDPPQPAPTRAIINGADGLPVQQEVRRADARKYAEPFPAAWAVLGTEGALRFLRVVPVAVSPYRWDPSLRAVLVASRLEVEIRFEADPAAGEGGLVSRRARERVPGPDEPGWDRLYDNVVLNAESARAWRRAPALRTGVRRAKSLITAPEFRIPVTKSDLYRVPHASLVAAGWDLTAVPVSRVALFERFFDERSFALPDSVDRAFREQPVSIQVRDLDGDDQFGPGDDFIFFGLNAWDRLHPEPRDKRYGREHDYFVTVRDEGGARFAEGPSLLAPPRNDLVPVTTSVVTRRYEGDGVYMPSYAAGDETGTISLGVNGILHEHMYWVGGGDGDYPIGFDLPGILAGPGNLLRLSVPVQGTLQSPTNPRSWASFSVSVRGGSFVDLPDTLSVPGKDRRVYDLGRDGLAAFTLGPAGNTLRMRVSSGFAAAALDWMEWTWRRDLIAVDRRLFFQTNDIAGPREFHLLGFGPADTTAGSRLVLLDLADSARTAATPGPRLLTWRAAQVDSVAPGSVALRVQLDLGDPPRPRTIYAVSPAAAIVPSGIEPVSPVDPTEPDGPDEDLVIITHPDFLDPTIVPGVESLAQARDAQGLSVRVVTTRQIYDRFNGGRPGPVAIRNYLRYLFRARVSPPSFLLLVGDASDDFTGATASSAPNFVPTQTVFSDAWADQGRELVSSDEWFVDNLTGLGERVDFLPDMHIGRIPAGTPAELKVVVEKILSYGVFRDTDTWRSRSLLISDDEFSTTLAGTDVYKYQGDTGNPVRRTGESVFRWAARETRRIIQKEAGFAEFGVDSFFTATYMDTVPGLQRCRERAGTEPGCIAYPCPYGEGAPNHCLNKVGAPYADIIFNNWREDNYEYGKTVLPPILRQYLNRGHLLAIYQGHSNGHLMSHEYIYQDAPGIREDTQLLQNDGRPFFFMGFGCHLAEFSGAAEGDRRGDCICEKMLLADHGRGAVAALASTAYEWMGNSAIPNLAIVRSMFVDPPRDPVTGRSRWLLGEIVTAAKSRMGFSAPHMVATYTLLGDPSMPLEMAPPSLSVFVNCDPDAGPLCEPWTEGTVLEAEAGSDTARIRVLLRDEQSLSGRVTLRDAAGIIDSSAYRLVSDPDHPGDDRRLDLAYDRGLVLPAEDYGIEIEVTDAAGRIRRALLPVRLDAEFFTVQDGARLPIRPEGILEPGDSVIVRFAGPVGVDGGATGLWLDDRPLPIDGRPPSPGLRRGELRAVLPDLTEGEHRLRFRTSAPGGAMVERAAVFQGPGEALLLLLYNFPNPFEEGTAFYYRLNRTGISAKLMIFTLSGRKIWSADGPARANDNAIVWDGRDADGDAVANGVYLYKLEVRTTEGRTLSRVERVARIR
jgi:hypothetical protein